jgi:hypothetical protein
LQEIVVIQSLDIIGIDISVAVDITPDELLRGRVATVGFTGELRAVVRGTAVRERCRRRWTRAHQPTVQIPHVRPINAATDDDICCLHARRCRTSEHVVLYVVDVLHVNVTVAVGVAADEESLIGAGLDDLPRVPRGSDGDAVGTGTPGRGFGRRPLVFELLKRGLETLSVEWRRLWIGNLGR